MNGKLLFQTDLDRTTDFLTEWERSRYMELITAQFRQALDREFRHGIVPDISRERILRFFRIFVKINAYFYVPLTVRYSLLDNVMWFGVKSAYILIDYRDLPGWRTLMEETGLEISSNDDGCFRIEFVLVGNFNKL